MEFSKLKKHKKTTLISFFLFLYFLNKVVFLIFWEIELSNPKNKTFLVFSQRKAFLIFHEMELFQKTSHILEENFPSSEKVLISGEMEFLVPNLLNVFQKRKKFFLYFRKELAKPINQNIFYFPEKKFSLISG